MPLGNEAPRGRMGRTRPLPLGLRETSLVRTLRIQNFTARLPRRAVRTHRSVHVEISCSVWSASHTLRHIVSFERVVGPWGIRHVSYTFTGG